jgi:2-C-methyl-D-erythritol 4-phosphate cytidylyltransferase/2-C-methyl-D-erythritol 2,4-cyclodiphosphate synthase
LPANKLLYKIRGKAVAEYALDNFAAARDNGVIDEIILIHSEADRAEMETIAARYGALTHTGGPTRPESVRRGLRFLRERGAKGADVVLICDGARPNTPPSLIAACAAAARRSGGAVAAYPVADTLRAVENGVFTRGVPRENTYAVQTPQAFRFDEIWESYEKLPETAAKPDAPNFTDNGNVHAAANFTDDGGNIHAAANFTDDGGTVHAAANFTDDGGVHAATGFRAELVIGSPDNYKITLPEDLKRFEREIEQSSLPVSQSPLAVSQTPTELLNSQFSILTSHFPRVGVGSDTHRLVSGRPLILGGVRIPHDKGLLGHSDADALIHAVMDALLSAAGLRDVGFYFPDNDPKYKGADSLKLLAEARAKIEQAGFRTVNVSAVISAESPRLSPYIDDMRARLADVLGIPQNRVGLTAKTGEGLGFIGRKEGVAATACATVVHLHSSPASHCEERTQ